MTAPAPIGECPPGLTAGDLDGFRAVQQLAYDCAEAMAAELRPGMTERQTVRIMEDWLRARGVRSWFHKPYAWFGARTAFAGFRSQHQFLPTSRRLQTGEPYILDVAPVVNGYTANIGYAGLDGAVGPLGNEAMWRLADEGLAEHRDLILDRIRAGRTLLEVCEDVDGLLARQGFTNRHRQYPNKVLAHRVGVIEERSTRTIGRFGVDHLKALNAERKQGKAQGWSPWRGPTAASDHPAPPGLWAVEPHLGFRGVGVKFEELLVVTEHDAYWLDDDLPHVRRWQERARSRPADRDTVIDLRDPALAAPATGTTEGELVR